MLLTHICSSSDGESELPMSSGEVHEEWELRVVGSRELAHLRLLNTRLSEDSYGREHRHTVTLRTANVTSNSVAVLVGNGDFIAIKHCVDVACLGCSGIG